MIVGRGGYGYLILAASLMATSTVALRVQAQSFSLPDGGSVEVSIGDNGGSVSITSPSTGIDVDVDFSFGGADPGSVSVAGPGGAGSSAIAVGRSRAVAIPGLSAGPTAGDSAGREQAARSIANAGQAGGRTAAGLEGEWVAGVQGPGYNVPGFYAGPVGSYGVDAPAGRGPDGQGEYTAEGGPAAPSRPSDAEYAVNAPGAAAGEAGPGAGAAPQGFNPITADQGQPLGGVGLAGIGPPSTGRPSEGAPTVPAGVAAPLGGAGGLAIPAPTGPSLGGQGLTTGPADKAPPPSPPPPRPTQTVIVIEERSDIFDDIADLLGVSRDEVFAVYEQNSARLSDLVAAGDRDALVAALAELAGQLLDGPRGPIAAARAPAGGFRNLARD